MFPTKNNTAVKPEEAEAGSAHIKTAIAKNTVVKLAKKNSLQMTTANNTWNPKCTR